MEDRRQNKILGAQGETGDSAAWSSEQSNTPGKKMASTPPRFVNASEESTREDRKQSIKTKALDPGTVAGSARSAFI